MIDYSRDPLAFIDLCWPEMLLYGRQAEILESVRDNQETFVHAANQTGKSHTAALVALWFFLTRRPARVIVSSSSNTQLQSVLWPAIRDLAAKSEVPLPVKADMHKVQKLQPDWSHTYEMDYVLAHVTNEVENFQGHHLPNDRERVLWIGDEASGIEDDFYQAADSWDHRKLVIGNPLSLGNFFHRKCKAGSAVPRRCVIHISADDSPNVVLGKRWEEVGREGEPPLVIPGLVTYAAYLQRIEEYDEPQRVPRVYGQFYEGSQVLLFPSELLAESRRVANGLVGQERRAVGMGIDSGQGRDLTVWTVVDELGIIEQIAVRLDSAVDAYHQTVDLMNKHELAAQRVCVDFGGGGKELADFLHRPPGGAKRQKVRRVHFGEAVSKKLERNPQARDANRVVRYTYKNRRAEMYGRLRDALRGGFGLLASDAAGCHELEQELHILPLQYDAEGKLYLPPKEARTAGSTQPTIRSMLGRSPDRADSLVLAVYAMQTAARAVGVEMAAVSDESQKSFNEQVENRMAKFMEELRQ